jgi:hypothetical protein
MIWGWVYSVDAKGCNENVSNPDMIKKFGDELIEAVNMEKHGECQLEYFGKDNKKGINNLDNEIKNLLKSQTKKRSLFSIQKTHSIRNREAKEKKDVEEKEKALANPPSPDELIEKSKVKWLLLLDTEGL